MGKTHSWINFIHINKGNIADLQNDTFLLAQQAVRPKGIPEFSSKVSAPKAIKWMFGTACRNTGQRELTSWKQSLLWWAMKLHNLIQRFEIFLSLPLLALYLATNLGEGRVQEPEAHTGWLCINSRTVQPSPVPVWMTNQSLVPWHAQGACYL